METNREWRRSFIINVKRKGAIPVYKVDTHNDREVERISTPNL